MPIGWKLFSYLQKSRVLIVDILGPRRGPWGIPQDREWAVDNIAANAYFSISDAITWMPETIVPAEYETHGAEEIAIYARGPFAHLFHSTHEQNYIRELT